MNKKRFSLFVACIALFTTNSYSQLWDGSSVNTFTGGNVGIGTTAYPKDARLHIFGKVGISGFGTVFNVPELMLDRSVNSAPLFIPTINFLEVWNTQGSLTGTTRKLLDVIDYTGKLGILTSTPSQALDVNANALIEKSLAVNSNIGIGTASTYPADARLSIYNQFAFSLPHAPLPIPEVKISRSTIAGGGGNYLEIYKGVGGTYTMLDVINNKGWVGILNSSPTEPLDVNGNALIEGGTIYMGQAGTGYVGRNIVSASNNGWLGLLSGTTGGTSADGSYLQLYTNISAGQGSAVLVTSGSNPASGMTFAYNNSGTSVTNMAIQNSGKVVIGSSLLNGSLSNPTPNGYLLYVAEGIMTEKLNVAVAGSGNWSDFVFNKDYNLMPLNKVESYVTANKHLPDVPNANDIVKNGIDVAKMDAKLLQKIEELTLYAIDQQKQSAQLQQIVAQQQKEIEELEKKIK